jgi:hypothetical protein
MRRATFAASFDFSAESAEGTRTTSAAMAEEPADGEVDLDVVDEAAAIKNRLYSFSYPGYETPG